MSKTRDLRKLAEQARRAARIRTEGGQAADRQLLALAIRLEEEAANADRNAVTNDKSPGGR
jgi:hypothetical protein